MSGRAGFSRKGLTIVSRATWAPLRSIALKGEGREYVSLDPSGRVWVAHYGMDTDPGTTVEVFQPDGERIVEIATCRQNRRVVFAADHAFVACEQNGFKGILKRIDLNTLAVDGTIDVSFPSSSYAIITGTGTIPGAVVLSCLLDSAAGSAGVILLDPVTLSVIQSKALGSSAYVEQLLPYGSSALLLNVASPRSGTVSDVFELGGMPATVSGLSLFASPCAGAVIGDMLFGYSILGYPQQGTVSRRNMVTFDVTHWSSPLPGTVDRMGADDQQVFVSYYETNADAADGLYALDQNSGQLTKVVNVADVTDFALGSGS
jgi:hypothetical protein